MKENSTDTKTINLLSNNIGLPTPKNRNVPSSIHHENRYVKKQNEALKRQLESISFKLDEELKKRADTNKKKPWSRDPDEVSYLELQNAYKKCQIYKKEVNFYRRRLSTIQDESKYEQFDSKMNECLKQNAELKNEIKSLNKLIKLQQKGLAQMGTEEFTRITKENQQLKEQNRRLKKHLSQSRVASLKSRQFNKSQQLSPQERKQSSERKPKNDNPYQLREKLERNYQKVKHLTIQLQQLKNINQNYRFQIQERDKEINLLKQRIANLRRNNDYLLSQRNIKKLDKPSRKNIEIEENKISQPYQNRAKFFKTQSDQPNISNLTNFEAGSGSPLSMKWSDEAFNSKIKEIEVILDDKQQIKDIHARYEKGESKKYIHSNSTFKSAILSCSEKEHIISIQGIFSNNCLKYLTLKTNNKRGQSFGAEKEENIGYKLQNFTFQAKQSQNIGALFGQRSEEGITKLGCFILKN